MNLVTEKNGLIQLITLLPFFLLSYFVVYDCNIFCPAVDIVLANEEINCFGEINGACCSYSFF